MARAATVLAGVGVLAGCGLVDRGEDGATTDPVPVSTFVGEPAAMAPVVETSAPAAAAVADPALVASCVEYVQFQAYVGDTEGLEIWQRAGETAEGLDAECTTMAVEDPDFVQAMSDELAELRQQEADAAANASASTTLAPGCHPSYGDCLPIVSDIDCVGDRSGDGPVWQALAVLVYGPDEYDMDKDGDGLACEAGDR